MTNLAKGLLCPRPVPFDPGELSLPLGVVFPARVITSLPLGHGDGEGGAGGGEDKKNAGGRKKPILEENKTKSEQWAFMSSAEGNLRESSKGALFFVQEISRFSFALL